MRLLIVTQVVDTEHPVLGFFHRWVEEFAKHVEHIHVIALQTGKYNLPQNVTVHSLGKERGIDRLGRVINFFKYLLKLRKEYDTVFVHMNPEYIVLAGWWWRVTRKKLGLWYMHKSVDTKLKVAEKFAQHIFTATPYSFRMKSNKVHHTGHGIDTDFFTSNTQVPRGRNLLSVGRLMPSKRHDLVIRTAAISNRTLKIAGDGPELANLEALADEVGAQVTFLGGLNQEELIQVYREAGVFVHTSETGSLDKVVLEALACGCPVITTNPAFKDLPVILSEASKEALAHALEQNQDISMESRMRYIKENHSLQKLIPTIIKHLS